MTISTLFSGIGAPETALKRLGIDYNLAYFCDIDKYGFEQAEFNDNFMIKYVHGRHTDDRFTEDYITIYVDRTTREIMLYNDWDDEEIGGLENEIQDLLRDGIVRKEK